MLLKQRCQSVRTTSQAIPRMALLPDMASSTLHPWQHCS